MSAHRRIKAMQTPGITPSAVSGCEPEFLWVDPANLVVNETYQRNLSERSVTLIRKIVGGWSWSKFKPPIVVRTDDGLEVVDGQHTAIAALSHPGIATIPVMLVAADTLQERADAFLGHNADRIAVTPLQMHHAAVLAGDETAMTISQVCARAGVRIPKNLPGSGKFKAGDCVAVSCIRALVNRRGAMGARRVLEICAKARLAPVGMSEIRGVEECLYGDRPAEADDVVSALISLGASADQRAKSYAADHGVRQWQGMAKVLERELTQ